MPEVPIVIPKSPSPEIPETVNVKFGEDPPTAVPVKPTVPVVLTVKSDTSTVLASISPAKVRAKTTEVEVVDETLPCAGAFNVIATAGAELSMV